MAREAGALAGKHFRGKLIEAYFMHINSIACGQGAPSIWLIIEAGRGLFPADLVQVYDTGNENDMLWSTGQHTTAGEFFEQVTKPLAEEFGVEAVFVRANDGNGNPRPPLHLDQRNNGKVEIDLPMFGSNGGRLMQSCTDKWKKQAGRQELRRRGATSATTYLGLTMDEVHRIKQNDVRWEHLEWPLITMKKMYRAEIEREINKMNIPYIIRSQCDFCPHKNLFRWRNSSPGTIAAAAKFEAEVGKGEFFLTDLRIPLIDALRNLEDGQSMSFFDTCDSGYCFT